MKNYLMYFKITGMPILSLMLINSCDKDEEAQNVSSPGVKMISSASKKTTLLQSLSQESAKDKAFEVLKINKFTFVNVCFQDESNAVFGVFLQRLSSAKFAFNLVDQDNRSDNCYL